MLLFYCKCAASPAIARSIPIFINESGNVKKNEQDYKNILLNIYEMAVFFCLPWESFCK